MTTSAQPIRRGRGARYTPALIVLLFLAPMIAAWVAFKYFPEQMRALGTNNYGKFIQPPRAIDLHGLVTADGEALDPDYFQGKWTYLYVDDRCETPCRAALYQMRQVRLAQGGERDRVQRLFVLSDGDALAQVREVLQRNFPNQPLLIADAGAQQALRQSLQLDDQAAPLTARRIYIVDPLGRAMMYYEPVQSTDKKEVLAKATGMRKDMAKLLKNSKTQ